MGSIGNDVSTVLNDSPPGLIMSGLGMGTPLGNAVQSVTGQGGPLGGLSGADLSGALAAETAGTTASNQIQQNMYNTTAGMLSPYQAAGSGGLSSLQAAMPSLTSTFNPQNLQNTPGYQFSLNQGEQAINNSAAARGVLNSGGTQASLNNYAQGAASTQYQTALQNYNTQNQQTYGMLSGLANYGQTANQQMATLGTSTANNMSSNTMGGANASSAALMASANQMSNLMGQGAGMVGMIASDRRVKKNVRAVSQSDIKEFKDNITPYEFNYTDDKFGKGDWIGVMAQDLEKSKLGRTVVETGNDGVKRINHGKLSSLMLAMNAKAS